MVVSTTQLSFQTNNRNLWAPGEALNLTLTTGDKFIYDPGLFRGTIGDMGSLFGLQADIVLDLKIGARAYATAGEAGSFDTGIDITVNTRHSAIVSAEDRIRFDFSDFRIDETRLDVRGFGAGGRAALEIVYGIELGLENLRVRFAGIDYRPDDFKIIDRPEQVIEILAVEIDTELPFDLGYGVTFTLSLPTGASGNTTRTDGIAVIRDDEVSDQPFLKLDVDVDELILTLLGKIKVPQVVAVVEFLENTLFATFEFDLADYVGFLAADILGLEIEMLDLSAEIGAAVSEKRTVDYSRDGNTALPAIDIALRSDNGTPGDLTDDQFQTAKLGDADVQLRAPGFEGTGTVKVDATFNVARASFGHSIGVDLTGGFTIEALTFLSTGWVGEKIGIDIGPLFSRTFPTDGFRVNLLSDLFTNEFDIDPADFNTERATYDIFYSRTLPQLFDTEAPGAVQELIAYDAARQVNAAASATAFAQVIAGRPSVNYGPDGALNNTALAEFSLWAADVVVGNADLSRGLLQSRDVVLIDTVNTTGVPLGQLEASYTKAGQSVSFPIGGQLDASETQSQAAYLFLRNLPTPGQIGFNSDGGLAEGTVLSYVYNNFIPAMNGSTFLGFSGRMLRTENSVNILGNARDDVLVYWGDEARLIDGGGQIAGSATGDVLIANFRASHEFDTIEWDLRSNAVGQSGDSVGLKLSRGGPLATIAGTAMTLDGYQAVSGAPGRIEIAPGDADGVATAVTGPLGLTGRHSLRLTVEDTGNGESSFEVRIVTGTAGNFVTRATLGTYTANDSRAGQSFQRDFVVRDADLLAGDRIMIVGTRGGATGPGAEAARISQLRVWEQHDVSFRNIESFLIETSSGDDLIFTSTFADQIIFGSGEDTLFLTADRHAETMDMGNGSDIVRIEIGGAAALGASGTVRDDVWGQSGLDEAIVTNVSAEGARWSLFTPDPALGTGRFLTGELTAATATDTLLTAQRGLAWIWRDSLLHLREFSLPADMADRVEIQIDVVDPAARMGVRLANFEAVSFEGSDTGADLAFFTGGAFTYGGDGDGDTIVADFSNWTRIAGDTAGVILVADRHGGSTPPSLFPEGPAVFRWVAPNGARYANEVLNRTSVLDGFERILVVGTAEDDILIGGRFNDYIEGGDGDDVLANGGTGVVAANLPLGGDVLYAGAGNDRLLLTGDGKTWADGDAGDDFAIFSPGNIVARSLAEGFALGGLQVAYQPTAAGAAPVVLRVTDTGLTLLARSQVMLADGNWRTYSFANDRGIEVVMLDIERRNLSGLDETDDLLVFDGGATYLGGERAGDRDTFVADFSTQGFAMRFGVEADVGGITLANGVHLAGIDRIALRLGTGDDVVSGGAFDDVLFGGDGSDVLRGGGSSGPQADIVFGGNGSDILAWNANDGIAIYNGGADNSATRGASGDRLVVSAVGEDGRGLAPDGGGFGWTLRDALGVALPGTAGVTATTGDIWKLVEGLAAARGSILSAGAANRLTFSEIESVEIQGSGEEDDVILYLGGSYHDGGERDGDADVFAADFSAETRSLRILAQTGLDRAQAVMGQDLGNGAVIANFERLYLNLGQAADLATGGDFADRLHGNGGDDQLDGGLGNDVLFGGEGDDRLFYSGGRDVIGGGTGLDLLELGGIAAGYRTLAGFDAAGAQVLSVSMASMTSTAAARVALGSLFDDLGAAERIVMAGGADAVDYRGVERIVASGEGADDLLLSGGLGGILSGDGGNDVLVGRGGNDLMAGGAGYDRYAVAGLWGDDVIAGETAGRGEIHVLRWTRAQVTFSLGLGASGADDLVMTAGDNRLTFLDYFRGGLNGLGYTFVFDDQTVALDLRGLGATFLPALLSGGVQFGTTGRDEMLVGTAGADAYFARTGADLVAGSLGPDLINGGLGADGVSYDLSPVANEAAEGVIVNLATGFGQNGHAASDLLISVEDILGSRGRDLLFGSSVRNAIAGGLGNDTINGGAGDDFLSGDGHNDLVTGGLGNDILLGGSGDDSLFGAEGDDTVDAGTGNDRIDTGAGNDVASGGDGVDTAVLGEGNDVWRVEAPAAGTPLAAGGADTVAGGNGSDWLDFADFGFEVSVFLGGATGGAQIAQSRGATEGVPGGADVVILRASGFDNVRGSSQADGLVGGTFANRLQGMGGNDVFIGHQGNDTFEGGTGIDIADYSSEAGGNRIIADLAAGVIVDSYGNDDLVVDIEHVVGSDEATNGLDADDLFGSSRDDIFTGNGGRDVDLIDGRAGIDTVDYSREAGTQNYLPGTTTPGPVGQGVVVDLSLSATANVNAPNATDTRGHGDALVSIENVIGSIRSDRIRGGEEANVFVGGDGADTLEGAGGFDTVDYGREIGTLGIIVLGNSAIDSFGRADVLSGIEGINGTARGDRIEVEANVARLLRGGAGDDILRLLQTGADADGSVLSGGDGNDALIGADGGDLISGGKGDDTAEGLGGDDVFLHGGGRDVFDGGNGLDVVAFDEFATAVRIDMASGRAFARDSLGVEGEVLVFSGVEGGRGSGRGDLLEGGAAGELLQGGAGDDTLSGGNGADRIEGGDGTDLLDYSAGSQGVALDLSRQIDNATDGFGVLETVTGVERIVATAFADRLIGGTGDETFEAGAGNDTVDGGAGYDRLVLASAGGIAVTITGYDAEGGAIGTVSAPEGDDEFRGIEHVLGGNGDFDDLSGGDGNDVFTGNAGVQTDNIFGGNGIDTVDYSAETGGRGVFVDLGTAPGFLNATDTHGHGDFLSSIERVIGTSLDDALRGGAGDEALAGGAGNDSLRGGAGNDTLLGGEGIDLLDYSTETGAAGVVVYLRGTGTQAIDSFGNDDVLAGIENLRLTARDDEASGDDVANRIEAGAGNDTLDGWLGNDTLLGEAGADRLLGWVGDDLMFGGQGNDTLAGETGDDTLNGGEGADELDGGAGRDTASYAGLGVGVSASLATGRGIGGQAEGDTYAGIDNLFGTQAGDRLEGDGLDNRLDGAGGNDLLLGGAGADTLAGGVGNDTLDGGTGADRMEGGGGDDLYVTFGGDQIVETANAGTDTVESSAAHTLGAHVENLVLTGTAAISGTGNGLANRITGNDAANRILAGAGTDSVDGGAGNDSLNGWLGADTLAGGAGEDSFIFSNPFDGTVDIITDFVVVDDRVMLENAVFTGLGVGVLSAAAFVANAGGAATSGQHRILYETDTGSLRFDADGSGSVAAAVEFARLAPGLALTAADIFVF